MSIAISWACWMEPNVFLHPLPSVYVSVGESCTESGRRERLYVNGWSKVLHLMQALNALCSWRCSLVGNFDPLPETLVFLI